MRRKVLFVNGEFYHIFNRGTDKRNIFSDKNDAFRFLESIEVFNNIEAGNNIFRTHRLKNGLGPTQSNPEKIEKKEPIVNIICYCLNSNHYHFILEQLVDGGISEFMKRLGGGYTCYYNERHKRSGVLFQGKFKAAHIKSNEQLLRLSSYVNLNNKVHQKFDKYKKNFLDLIANRSSWEEYIKKDNKYSICKKDIILGQFKNREDYRKNAEDVIKEIKEMRYGEEINSTGSDPV
ncbi:hypothetical protein A2996_03655 [Candidatus Campbellbacteria bacterium RIFCSPLOWO2_01_FULL_34_15]|uniref:Transposase IS200-like domain-containing protein n=2 Tax=Candidatus Campbelliibacteriota TaxID=1752727 RepID=A0A1F5EQ72_9BACT|nr:MAG: hypothetical protein A2811_01845 [Candidatus Campbellbacteria bacterium RIFCSPHIGHO2_01_FULL_34_10]OGD69531.1 MAG: hypothetical protein A2996_03655 [Candidatus Campbellbacteria bacterium RIFCSPLOWO2_01_FULL_34_15]